MALSGYRTFAFTLSTSRCGTTAIARVLRSLGCDAHHEILQNSQLYYRWMKRRFSPCPAYEMDAFVGTIRDYIGEYLSASVVNKCNCGCQEYPLSLTDAPMVFADISHFTSCLWPLIFKAFSDVRCVHITRHGGVWVERFMSQYGLEALYGETEYPAHGLPDREFERLNPFEKACWYWNSRNRYFLMSGAPRFKAEELGDHAEEVCGYLYPEGDKKKFAAGIRNIDNSKYRWNDWRAYEKRTFERMCGETMAMLGY
jgi:hypothetical protein